MASLEECASEFKRLAAEPGSTAEDFATLDAAIEELEEPTSVMLLADVRVEVARRAERAGRPAEALAECNRALKSWPENCDALLLRGSLRRALGELELAESDWLVALDHARAAVADYVGDEEEEEEGEDWEEDPVCRSQVCAGLAAQHELALLLSQLGRHAEADAHLTQLGMEFKLSPALMEWPTAKSQAAKAEPLKTVVLAKGQKRPLDTMELCGGGDIDADAPVAVLDGILSDSLIRRLLEAFKGDAPFWTEHGYPTGHFFSYLRQLPASDEAECRKSLMDELMETLRPLVEERTPQLLAGWGAKGAAKGSAKGGKGKREQPNTEVASVTGEGMRMGWAEWWCHSRPLDGGHQLHFDLDEASLPQPGSKRKSTVRSPAVSTILYLSLPDSKGDLPDSKGDLPEFSPAELGGPTVVLDQRLGDRKLAERAWLVPSRRVHGGRLCLFDGSLLHGVLPGKPQIAREKSAVAAAATAAAPAPPRRLTLMIGWWPADEKPPKAARSNGPPFAPCMREPSAPKGAKSKNIDFSREALWPTQLLASQSPEPAEEPATAPLAVQLQRLSPAWVQVSGDPAGDARADAAGKRGDDTATTSCPATNRLSANATCDSLAGGLALPADALEEVNFFGRWFIPSAEAIDEEILGAV
mmetsp:Transcript_27441/g.69291  ORF Transcript_27441/g.69291 Transcript_27441/m.69291 type:complete len:645 (+) Transcript_27441:144-2078(+)